MRCLLIVALVAGCDSTPQPAASPQSEPSKPLEPARVPTPAAPELEPLAAAPAGTVVIDRRYVHTCAEAGSCPTLMQRPGAAHCRGLTLGGLTWRLPSVKELESWKGDAALAGYDVFHWSGTAWDEDPEQLWIFDPGSGSKTTAKPTRKPFTIRCVAEPG